MNSTSLDQLLLFANYIISGVVGVAALFLILRFLFRSTIGKLIVLRYPQTDFGFRGKLRYIDDQNHPVLLNHAHKLSAKPDYIFTTAWGECTLVELKSRYKGLYDSDIWQVYATVLCARANGYAVKKAFVVTKSEKYAISLGSNRRLLKQIKRQIGFVSNLRKAKQRQRATLPEIMNKCEMIKCQKCAYFHLCQRE